MACGADQAAPGSSAKRQVLPYHCGVQAVLYDGKPWEVEAPPFDATNAPKALAATARLTQQPMS